MAFQTIKIIILLSANGCCLRTSNNLNKDFLSNNCLQVDSDLLDKMLVMKVAFPLKYNILASEQYYRKMCLNKSTTCIDCIQALNLTTT